MFGYRWSVGVFARAKTFIRLIAALLLLPGIALAGDKEPFAVLQLGSAGEWSAPDGGSGFGPTAALEFAAIKDRLLIEAGVTSLFSRGQSEQDATLVFKKPFDLSPTVEFEPGIGPQWNHTTAGGRTTDSLSAEAVLDFMVWPARERKFGWFLEPSYNYNFGNRQQSVGMSAGLLIGIP
jgi:hypothetical protein